MKSGLIRSSNGIDMRFESLRMASLLVWSFSDRYPILISALLLSAHGCLIRAKCTVVLDIVRSSG